MKDAPTHRRTDARVLIPALALAFAATPLQAQIANHLSLGAGGAATRLRVETPGALATLSGVTLHGSGRLAFGRLAVEGFYRQGSLTPDSGTGTPQDLVEARVLAVFRPLAWLQVGAGPHARAVIVPGSTAQWVFIEGRARAEGFVIGETVRTHVELWMALSAQSNIPGGGASARGGEAGLTVRLARSPVWGRLTYAIDRAALTGAGRIETVEDISLSVGFGRP